MYVLVHIFLALTVVIVQFCGGFMGLYVYLHPQQYVHTTDQTICVYNKHKSCYNILCIESGFLLVQKPPKTTSIRTHHKT